MHVLFWLTEGKLNVCGQIMNIHLVCCSPVDIMAMTSQHDRKR